MGKQNDYEAEIDEFFGENGRLSTVLSGFEFREGQLIMARAVGRAFAERRPLMVEAGTGTGKTLAYLVPALFSGKKIVVSTGTINLQEQIVQKDVPIIERATGPVRQGGDTQGARQLPLPAPVRAVRAAARPCAWGRGQRSRREIERWARTTKTGDRAELTTLPAEFALWGEISSSPESVPRAKMPPF